MDQIALFRLEVYDKLGEILNNFGDNGFISIGPKIIKDFYNKHREFFRQFETIHVDSGYTRKRVICDNKKHASRFMEWSPNCVSPIHEHAGRVCFDIITEGKMLVINFRSIKIGENEEYKLEEINRAFASPGDVVIVNPQKMGSDIHIVLSPYGTTKSLHFYPIDHKTIGIYKPKDHNLKEINAGTDLSSWTFKRELKNLADE